VDRHGDPLPDGAVARLGTLRWRAAGEVKALGFWPDGRTLAAVSGHGARLFAPDGRIIRHVPIGDSPLFAILGLSPDGKLVAVEVRAGLRKRGGKRVIQIWGLVEARKVREHLLDLAPDQPLPWLGWSADGKPVVVLVTKNAVVFRELATGRDRRLESADAVKELGHIAHAPKAGVLVARDQRRTFHVWDTATGRELRTFPWMESAVEQTAISPDGTILAVLMEKGGAPISVRLVEVATGKVRHTLAADQKQLAGVLFSPNGKTVATFGLSEVRLYDPATGREQDRLPEGVWSWRAGAFSPDGQTLATVNWTDPVIRVRDRAGKALRASPEGHTRSPLEIDISPDARHVASSGYDGRVFVWDSAIGRPLTRISGNGGQGSCAFSADGTSVFSLRGDNHIDVVDVRTGRTLHRLKGPDSDRKEAGSSGRLYLSDDRRNLVTVSQLGGPGEAVQLLLTGWDATTGKLGFQRRRRVALNWGVVSPDLRVLAVEHWGESGDDLSAAPGSQSVRVEALATGERLLDLPEIPNQTSPVAFSARGRLLATTTLQYIPLEKEDVESHKAVYTLRLWELASAKEVLVFPVTSNHAVAFSADGRLLALGGEDRQVVLYDLRRGRELRRLRGFDAVVTALAFSPDGRWLVSGLEDSTLLIWDVTLSKPGKLGPADAAALERAWAALAGPAKQAFAARGALALCPAETVAFLKGRLQPIRPVDPALLRRLLADLDGDTFAGREKARAELERLGERAADALREALGRTPSLEARRRLEALLARLRGLNRDREKLRVVRAVAVLEDIGTPEARAVLKALAEGVGAARQTQEAQKALERASRRRP
jgi:WD40 repeat protein